MDGAPARYHSLDALRAAMMLLGLVLHSAASYTATPLGEGWPYQDLQTSRHFELPLFLIHLFRMPAFFAAAGFFAALLYERDGAAGFARNRAKRVLLPLGIFWALVGPLVLGGFYFAMTHSGRITGPELLASVPLSRELTNPSPLHLWFLWYLVLFYAATLAVLRLAGARRVRAETAAAHAVSHLGWLTGRPFGVAIHLHTDPSVPYHSVRTAGSSLRIAITGVSADRGSYRVRVYR